MKKLWLPLTVAGYWLVLIVVELSTGAEQPRAGTDALSALFSGPASLMEPIRNALMAASSSLPGVGGQLFAGLTIGDTSRVSEELSQAMKAASMTHLVAVSGANCHIVTAACFAVLSWVGAPRWLRIWGSVITLGAFVALVTPGASVTRAAVMSLAVLVGLALGRLSAGLPVLALAAGVLLLIEPAWAINYGFVLSVLATLGLLVLTRPITTFLARWMSVWLATALAVPISASLLCQPVIILLSPHLPTYGVLANLLAVPAAGLVTVVGMLTCMTAVLWMPGAVVLAWLAWLPSEWIGRVAQAASGLPFAQLDWPTGLGGLLAAALVSASAIFAMFVSRGVRRRVAVVILVVTLGSSAVWTIGSAGHAVASVPVNWRIAACDVGQGDAVLLRGARPDGGVETALIDTGRSPEVMRACLTRLHVSHVNVLVLTHYDLDHVGGASALVGKVDRVILGKPEKIKDEALLAELCHEKTTCDLGRAGMTGVLGDASWQVLWPDGITANMQTGNPGSISMIVRWPDLSAAFVADLGAQSQEALLDSTLDIPAVDVLKVAHHGSADTSERLVTRFHPKIALISVGAQNGYGHPTRKALSMLEKLGTVVGRTDRHGFLFVVREAATLRLDTDR